MHRWHLLLLGLLSPALAAQAKRAIQPSDVAQLRDLADFRISPDGRRAVFVVREPEDTATPGERNTDLWLVPTDGTAEPRRLTASPKTDESPRWSPDGRTIAFLSSRGATPDTTAQIYLIPVDGGEAQIVTHHATAVEGLAWLPDGSGLLFTARDSLTQAERDKQRRKDDAIEADRHEKYAGLWRYTLASKTERRLTAESLHVVDFDVAADGHAVALVGADRPALDRVYWHSAAYTLDLKTNETTRLADGTGPIRFAPAGDAVAFSVRYTGLRSTGLPAVLRHGGAPKTLAVTAHGTVTGGGEWLADGRHLLVVETVGASHRLATLDVDADTFTTVAPLEVSTGGATVSVSRDGRTALVNNQETDQPDDLFAVDVASGKLTRLTRLNPDLRALAFGKVEQISWHSGDGRTVYGVLITPPDFRPGKRYPTVVHVHGGPEWAWWVGFYGSWHEWDQLLASHGVVVLLPNPRGSDGQGPDFVAANKGDWGGMDWQDILAGLDELVRRGVADTARLGIGGWSYGGFMTAWAVTHTLRFKAAVMGAGVSDLIRMQGTSDIIPSFLNDYFGPNPWGDPRARAAYRAHSPIEFIQNARTPTLVLHGGSDVRVPTPEGAEFYNALRQQGVEAHMVIYPREPHGPRERMHQLDILTRVLAWYEAKLK